MVNKLILFGLIFFLALATQVHAAWWDNNYLYKEKIWINTTTENLTTYYTVNLTNVNTASLISSGKMKSDCYDLRVIYNDSFELDRVVQNCNNANSWIEFRAYNNISTNTNDTNYSIYYGYVYAYPPTPPTNWNNIYWFADDFSIYDSSKWTNNTPVNMTGYFKMNCTAGSAPGCGGYCCDLESKQKNFTLPFSLEMGNTYWNTISGNTLVRRQLNATGWTTDFRAGLYCDGGCTNNIWLWFSINNAPGTGTACSFDSSNLHNRTIKIWNNSLVQYYQDSILTCTNGTNQNITQGKNWSVDLELSSTSGSIQQSTDYIIVRKLTNESTRPTLGLKAEENQCTQTIITNCTSGPGNITLNFTAYDEDSQALMNYSMDSTFSYRDASVNSMCPNLNFSYSYANNNTYFVCINPQNKTLSASATIKYYNSNYPTRYYYLQNAVLTNSTQSISLYLLNSSSATLVTMNVLDQMSNPQTGVIVIAQRQNIGSGLSLVTEGLSDYTGKAYAYLKIGEIYSFILIKNNVILNQYQLMQVQTNTLTFYISQSSVPEYFSYYGSVATTCNLDNSTNIMTCTYVDTSGLPMNMTMSVIQRTVAGDVQYCLNTSSSSVGTFVCNLTTNYSYKGSLTGTYYSSPRDYIWQSWTVSLSSSVNEFGAMGLLVSLLIALVAPFLGIYDARIAILLNGVAIIFCLWFGFLYGGASTSLLIVLVAVIDGIIIYKIKS